MIRLVLLFLGFVLTFLPVHAQEEAINLHPGQSGGGRIISPDTEGFATLTAEAGQVVDIMLISWEIDPILTLIAPDGTELATDDDSWSNLNAFLRSPVLPQSGDYTLKISTETPASYAQYWIETALVDDSLIGYGDRVEATLRADDLECVLYHFWGRRGDVIGLQIEPPAGLYATLWLSTGQTSCSGQARFGSGETVLQDDLLDGLPLDADHIILEQDGLYNIMLYRPIGYSGAESHVALTLTETISRTLDAGALTVRLSDKEPLTHLHMTLYAETSSNGVIMTITQQSYFDAQNFSVVVYQNAEIVAQYTTPPSSQLKVSGLTVTFDFPVFESIPADIVLTTDSTIPVTLNIEAHQYFGEG